jgi:hypothetical protein
VPVIFVRLERGLSGIIRFKMLDGTLCSHCPYHTNCRVTRTIHATRRSSQYGQGKPLGFLSAWLYNGFRFKSRASHQRYKPPYSERHAARNQFELEDGAVELLVLEGERLFIPFIGRIHLIHTTLLRALSHPCLARGQPVSLPAYH